MTKYGDLIKKAREPETENQETINTENQKSGLPEQEPELVVCQAKNCEFERE
ncbi:MAG: hypothetical protein HEQ20_18980 [Aphanizomenon flos-aquae KM1D3_PB]|uniref:hypothetical protein n=1 Tax=Aphanizomenon flos-aquae TaxID=1176 RepID=UPI000A7DC2DD|nr:hypothetical protein [Aphanizomenon flos-aquae]QSV69390.1 MAG: hypothetical protein HEQ20_18980 [Aphanizomenon flos-aquae KM1D3_PB]